MSPYSIGFVVKAMVLVASGLYFAIRYYRLGPPFWLGIILITTGFFDFRFQIERWLAGHDVFQPIHQILTYLIHLMFVGANTLYHYLVLIFYLETNGLIRRYMYGLLLIPLFITLLFRTDLYPVLHFDYTFTAIWGLLFWLASLLLAIRGMIRDRNDRIIYHIAISLMLQTNGLILILSHFRNQEFVEYVNMVWFSVFLAFCLLLLIWVNMRKVLVGLQREAVVKKIDMSTALLHHSFKNAIGKVKINAWNIRKSLANTNELSPEKAEEIEQYIQNLFSTYEHMMGMMTRISQMVRNKLEIRPEPVDLCELLQEAVQATSNFPRVKMTVHCESLEAYLDRTLVMECFINIIHNAVDAMQGEGTIQISGERVGRYIRISVRDNGPGMNKEQLSQVFEPFYSTKGRTGKNMGLGLYYVRKVMEAHKGKVTLQSEWGNGTNIILQFKHKNIKSRGSNGKDQRFVS